MLVFTLATKMCSRGNGSDYGIMFDLVEEEFGLFVWLKKNKPVLRKRGGGGGPVKHMFMNYQHRVMSSLKHIS